MKRVAFSVMMVFILGVVSVSAAGKNAEFTGIVISADTASVMVKSGNTEKIFTVASDAKRAWAAALKKNTTPVLEICQKVKVLYVKKGTALEAVSIEILKESDCYQ